MENVKQQKEPLEAIILVGGMGTRLRSVITDVPKPMAPIADRPFLSYILDDLQAQGTTRVILCTGYKHEVVETYYHDSYKGMKIVYSIEDTPLGTGGAIRKALKHVEGPRVLILNGDTMFRVDLREMRDFHVEQGADMTIALKKMENSERYGVVETADHKVVRFCEKQESKAGSINGGIYMLNKDTFPKLEELPEKFSFEKEFMEAKIKDINMMAYESDAYFIDIGIPEDYEKAQHELLTLV